MTARALAPKRTALQLAALVVVVAALTVGALSASGTTLGLLSANAVSSSNTITSGSVTLTSAAGGSCAATALLPGATPSACTLTASYSGSTTALLALDVLIETQAGNGGTPLYNPSDAAHELHVSITSTSPSVTYAVPTTATTCPSGAPTGSTCYALVDELVSATAFTSLSSPVVVSISLSLPALAPGGYRGGAAQVEVSVHATQSMNNGSTSTCTPGSECDVTSPGVGTPRWS